MNNPGLGLAGMLIAVVVPWLVVLVQCCWRSSAWPAHGTLSEQSEAQVADEQQQEQQSGLHGCEIADESDAHACDEAEEKESDSCNADATATATGPSSSSRRSGVNQLVGL